MTGRDVPGGGPQSRSTTEGKAAAPQEGSATPGAAVHEDEQNAVLTVDELAEMLRVDRKTVYRLIARGGLPGARRLGRVVRIHRVAVLAWLAQGQGYVSRSRRPR